MTEASGLVDDPAGASTSGIRRTTSPPLDPSRHPAAASLSDQLRDVARAAPLASLLTAFLIGVLVARRR